MTGHEEIIFRTITAFLLLWIFVHMLGKQTIFQKTYHLYIASITMGTLAGNLAFNVRISFWYFILAFVLMSAIILILNFLAVKSHRCRKWIAGEPVILIENGKIYEKSMKRIGYTLENLQQSLRLKDIFYIDEVELAILEVNGTLSVLKKPEYQILTRQDLLGASHIAPHTIPVEMILDGKILNESLASSIYSQEWLMDELKKRNLQVSEVAYAVMGSTGNLYIDLYQDQKDQSLIMTGGQSLND